MAYDYNRDEYEPILSVDIDSILAELPFNLIKETILEQIKDPVQTNIDYLSIIPEKCDIFKEQYETNEDLIREIDNSLRDFSIDIITAIDRRFGLGVDINDIAAYKDVISICQAMYQYFILRYVQNISRYLYKYINTHKSELGRYYIDKNKRDVSSINMKKMIKDTDAWAIISNLPSIIKYIISLDEDPYEFVDLSAKSHNYEASIVKSLIREDKISGDFVHNYLILCVDSHEHVIDELYTEIKLKIMKDSVAAE